MTAPCGGPRCRVGSAGLNLNVCARLRPSVPLDGLALGFGSRVRADSSTNSVIALPALDAIRDASTRVRAAALLDEVAKSPSHALASTLHQLADLPGARRFVFESVFEPPANQAEVYRVSTSAAVTGALAGHNATICCYGQSGGGKTYTIFGPAIDAHRVTAQDASSLGVLPRALHELFERLAVRSDAFQSTVTVRYLQLHRDTWYDLLAGQSHASGTGAAVSASHGVTMPLSTPDHCSLHAVTDVRSCLALLLRGAQAKAVASTMLNLASSRGHTIFQVILRRRPRSDAAAFGSPASVAAAIAAEQQTVESRLTFVDLAGSERVRSSGALADSSGQRLSEARSINTSLHALGRVLCALAERAALQAAAAAAASDTPSSVPALSGRGRAVPTAGDWAEAGAASVYDRLAYGRRAGPSAAGTGTADTASRRADAGAWSGVASGAGAGRRGRPVGAGKLAAAAEGIHIPWRSSKLTHFLHSCLEGSAASGACRYPFAGGTPADSLDTAPSLTLILCLAPADRHADESVSTCMFGSRARALAHAQAGDVHAAKALLSDATYRSHVDPPPVQQRFASPAGVAVPGPRGRSAGASGRRDPPLRFAAAGLHGNARGLSTSSRGSALPQSHSFASSSAAQREGTVSYYAAGEPYFTADGGGSGRMYAEDIGLEDNAEGGLVETPGGHTAALNQAGELVYASSPSRPSHPTSRSASGAVARGVSPARYGTLHELDAVLDAQRTQIGSLSAQLEFALQENERLRLNFAGLLSRGAVSGEIPAPVQLSSARTSQQVTGLQRGEVVADAGEELLGAASSAAAGIPQHHYDAHPQRVSTSIPTPAPQVARLARESGQAAAGSRTSPTLLPPPPGTLLIKASAPPHSHLDGHSSHTGLPSVARLELQPRLPSPSADFNASFRDTAREQPSRFGDASDIGLSLSALAGSAWHPHAPSDTLIDDEHAASPLSQSAGGGNLEPARAADVAGAQLSAPASAANTSSRAPLESASSTQVADRPAEVLGASAVSTSAAKALTTVQAAIARAKLVLAKLNPQSAAAPMRTAAPEPVLAIRAVEVAETLGTVEAEACPTSLTAAVLGRESGSSKTIAVQDRVSLADTGDDTRPEATPAAETQCAPDATVPASVAVEQRAELQMDSSMRRTVGSCDEWAGSSAPEPASHAAAPSARPPTPAEERGLATAAVLVQLVSSPEVAQIDAAAGSAETTALLRDSDTWADARAPESGLEDVDSTGGSGHAVPPPAERAAAASPEFSRPQSTLETQDSITHPDGSMSPSDRAFEAALRSTRRTIKRASDAMLGVGRGLRGTGAALKAPEANASTVEVGSLRRSPSPAELLDSARSSGSVARPAASGTGGPALEPQESRSYERMSRRSADVVDAAVPALLRPAGGGADSARSEASGSSAASSGGVPRPALQPTPPPRDRKPSVALRLQSSASGGVSSDQSATPVEPSGTPSPGRMLLRSHSPGSPGALHAAVPPAAAAARPPPPTFARPPAAAARPPSAARPPPPTVAQPPPAAARPPTASGHPLPPAVGAGGRFPAPPVSPPPAPAGLPTRPPPPSGAGSRGDTNRLPLPGPSPPPPVHAAATSTGAPAVSAAGARSPQLPPASVLSAALPPPPRGVAASAKPAAPYPPLPPPSPQVALSQQAPAPLPRDALKPQPPPGSRLARPVSEAQRAGPHVSPTALQPRPPPMPAPTPAPPAARLTAASTHEPPHGKSLPVPSGHGAVVLSAEASGAPVAATVLRPQPPPPRSARSTS